MRIYCLGLNEGLISTDEIGSNDIRFAFFSAVGTWRDLREPCKACDWHWQTIVAPLLVQWQPGSTLIGDFSWDGPYGYTFVVKEAVAERLTAIGFDCEFLPVEYVKPKDSRHTVPFLYKGSKLLWGECQIRVDLDKDASSVALEKSCSMCGDIRYTFRNKGIVIRKSDWHGEKMFRITTNGWSDATFITEEGRQLIEREAFSNVVFSEAGEIVN